jgi:hypothetical protein
LNRSGQPGVADENIFVPRFSLTQTAHAMEHIAGDSVNRDCMTVFEIATATGL